jgi:hypothetical protein
MSKIQFIIIDDIMEEFRKFLGAEVISNEEGGWGSCNFVVLPRCCPMKDGGKRGWINCRKCMIEYNCENYGTPEFREFLKTQNCRTDWLYPGQLAVWINK